MANGFNRQTQTPLNQSHGIYYEHKVPESFKSKVIKFYAQITGLKGLKAVKEKLRTGKDAKGEQPEPSDNILKKFDVTSWQVEGRNVYQIKPKQTETNKCILFLHGGAYVSNNTAYHWNMIEALTECTNCLVIAPDYPLAPLQTYIDSFRFIDPIYKKLVSEVGASNIILMGGSAGGGFALGLAQKLLYDGLPQPSQIILLSPWLDATCSNPEMEDLDPYDPLLTPESLRLAAEAYTRGGDINSHLVCPVNGPIEGLAKISVFISTHDVCYADAKKLKRICDEKEKEIGINFFVYPKMMHGWTIFDIPESKHAMNQIKALIDGENLKL